MSDYSNVLKVGTTSLIISMIEDNFVDFSEVSLTNPVDEIKLISKDLEMKQTYTVKNGKKLTAINIQEWYLEKSKSYLSKIGYDDYSRQVVEFWEQTLTGLKTDKWILADRIDWIAKLSLINKYREKQDLKLDDALIKSLDFKYSEITSNDGLAQILRSKNILKKIVFEDDIIDAISQPPTDTRAWFRGKVVAKFSKSIAAASWDSLILDLDKNEPLLRISTPDPRKGTKATSDDLLSKSNTVTEFANFIRSN
jgi:proteasome accessory factor A